MSRPSTLPGAAGLAALIGLAAGLAGCVEVWSVSAPPIGHPGAYESNAFSDGEVRLVQGTVLAFDCVDSFTGAACVLADMKQEDPAVAEILPAHLERKPSPWGGGTQVEPRAGFLIVARHEGATRVVIPSSIGERTIRVVVE